MAAHKLYLPYGTLHRVADARLVTFHWFCVSRDTPLPAPPAELIMGHKTLSEETRARAEATVKEFFSEDEFHQLRTYLRERHGEDLRTTLLCAPVSATKPDSGTQVGLERPFAQCVPAPGSGFHRLSEEEGYTLPFVVWGYYSLPARLRASALQAAAPANAVAAAAAAQAAAAKVALDAAEADESEESDNESAGESVEMLSDNLHEPSSKF